LVSLVSLRLSVPDVFDADTTLLYLVDQSGGSVRELLRLLDEAQLDAQVDGKTRVDMDSARTAAKETLHKSTTPAG
jgi:Cdc6-like AAA superfamily ATPase